MIHEVEGKAHHHRVLASVLTAVKKAGLSRQIKEAFEVREHSYELELIKGSKVNEMMAFLLCKADVVEKSSSAESYEKAETRKKHPSRWEEP